MKNACWVAAIFFANWHDATRHIRRMCAVDFLEVMTGHLGVKADGATPISRDRLAHATTQPLPRIVRLWGRTTGVEDFRDPTQSGCGALTGYVGNQHDVQLRQLRKRVILNFDKAGRRRTSGHQGDTDPGFGSCPD